MTWDTTGTNPILSVDQSSSGVTTAQDFVMTLVVLSNDGVTIATTSSTISVVNCGDASGANFAYNALGPVIDKASTQGSLFNWDVSADSNYYFVIQPL